MSGPTLAEIADQAGVSQATVSRVLNNKPAVSESTRQGVLTALDVLDYQRTTHLKPVTTGLVGLIVPELTNPAFASYAQAIETLLSRKGYATAVCTQAPGGMREDDYIRVLRSRQVSGIIVMSGSHADTTADMSTYHHLVDVGLPLVLVNGYSPTIATPQISDDDVSAMDQAIAHLVSLGHEHIGLAAGPRRYVPAQRKEQGELAAMARSPSATPCSPSTAELMRLSTSSVRGSAPSSVAPTSWLWEQSGPSAHRACRSPVTSPSSVAMTQH